MRCIALPIKIRRLFYLIAKLVCFLKKNLLLGCFDFNALLSFIRRKCTFTDESTTDINIKLDFNLSFCCR